jgi:hypothetical protein
VDMKVTLETALLLGLRVALISKGIGEVIEQGPGVTVPAIGTKVGIKYAAEACLNCGMLYILIKGSTAARDSFSSQS